MAIKIQKNYKIWLKKVKKLRLIINFLIKIQYLMNKIKNNLRKQVL